MVGIDLNVIPIVNVLALNLKKLPTKIVKIAFYFQLFVADEEFILPYFFP